MTAEPLRGGAGELTAHELAQRIINNFRQYAANGVLLHPVHYLPMAEELERALAAKAPQGVPIRNEDEIRERYGDAAVEMLRRHHAQPGHENCFVILGDLHAAEKGLDNIICNPATLPVPHSLVPKLPVVGPVSDTTIYHGMVPRPVTTVFQEHQDKAISILRPYVAGSEFGEVVMPVVTVSTGAPPNASPPSWRRSLAEKAKDEMSEFEKGFPYDGVTPAPGAERPMLEDLPHKIANRILTDDHGSSFYKWGLGEIERLVREALAAAPPPSQEQNIRDFIAQEIKIATSDRHASAERVRELEAALSKAHKIIQSELERSQQRGWAGWIAEIERALPPSTGEKS